MNKKVKYCMSSMTAFCGILCIMLLINYSKILVSIIAVVLFIMNVCLLKINNT